MATFQHRTAPGFRNNGGYNLRGLAHAPVVLQRTPRQQLKDASAKSVNKAWKITRNSKRSRGLHRRGNTCFRLSGIQSLLHLPKFVNWILSHNNTKRNGTIEFPCAPLHVVGAALIAKLAFSLNTLTLPNCPACVVKSFVQAYWGNQNIAADDEPEPWAHDHAQQAALRDLDQRLYVLSSGANARSQEDPTECLNRLLEACLASTDHTIAANAAWQDRFNALFWVEWDITWTCACGANQPVAFGTAPDGIGVPTLGIQPEGTRDSVSAAIARELTPFDLGDFDCPTCGLRQPRTQTKLLDGAPEFLRITLGIARAVMGPKRKLTHVKNMNPITFDRVLDLKDYQAVPNHPAPLKYHLKSVLCHGGNLSGGHWTATVMDPAQVNQINDHIVRGMTKQYLHSNPQGNRQVVVLTYAKVQTREA